MRTIAHVSDLHFGTEERKLTEGLLEDLALAEPSLIAVSGDLTQRARQAQFAAARAFLERLPAPAVAVPGNHDIPLFDVWRRFFRPLDRYRRWVHADDNPFWQDAELAVLGLNTARSNTWKHGRVSQSQIAVLRDRMGTLPADVFKVVVTHHPFVPPPRDAAPPIVGRGLEALLVAEACGVDLLLAGHLHEGYTADVRAHHVTIRRSILVAQAGTALSRRRRDEPNAYNLIVIDPPRLAVEVRAWTGSRFDRLRVMRYRRQDEDWLAVE